MKFFERGGFTNRKIMYSEGVRRKEGFNYMEILRITHINVFVFRFVSALNPILSSRIR